MKICFFGLGGVGGYYGTLVTQQLASKHDIYFVARGTHKEAIKANGLTLKKNGSKETITVHPTLCTDTTKDLPVCDIIILSVKAYDLKNAVHQLSAISDEHTLILPLLNGVDIYQRIRMHLHAGIVLPACVFIGTYKESPGVIYQNGGSCKITLGADPLYAKVNPVALLKLLKDANIQFEWDKNIQVAIWTKYIFIAAFGLVTAAYNKTLGQVLESSELSELTMGIMSEVKELARRSAVHLDKDIIALSMEKAKDFDFDTTTSFQRDVEAKGATNESDLFGGTIIRLGREFNVATINAQKAHDILLSKGC